jgi:hypothetical protein
VGWEKKQMAFDLEACPHSVTNFILFILSSSSRWVFLYRQADVIGQQMPDTKSEQCVNIKFLIKLKKYVMETYC